MASLVLVLLATFTGIKASMLLADVGPATRTFRAATAISVSLISIAFCYQLFGWWELFTRYSAATPWNVSVALATMAFALVVLGRWKRQPRYIRQSNRFLQPAALHELNRPSRIALIVVGMQLLVTMCITLAQFPRGYEGTAYHLPLAVHFAKTGSLLPWDLYYPHTFPALDSVFYGLVLGSWPERIASVTSFGFLPLLLVSAYGITRNLGASRSTAAMATCGMMVIPVVSLGVLEVQADILALSLVSGALYFATLKISNRSLRALLIGLLCGAAYSAKPTSFVACSAIAGILVVRTVSTGSDEGRARHVVIDARLSIIFIVGFLLMAGYWLARSWILFGNPLYPFSSPLLRKLFGWPVSEGFALAVTGREQFSWVRTPLEWFVYPWVEFQRAGQSYTAHTGYGLYTAGILIPCFLFAMAEIHKTWNSSCKLHAIWIGAILVIFGWAAVDRQPRYLLPVFAFVVPIAGCVIERNRGRARSMLHWISVAAIIPMSMAVDAKELIGFGDRIIFSKMTERHLFYQYPQEIDKLPAGAVILNVGSRTWHYPLFGVGLRNRVVSTPATRAALGLPASLAGITNPHLTGHVLRALGVTHVFADREVSFDDCAHAEIVGKLVVNSRNNQPLPEPRTLFRVSGCANNIIAHRVTAIGANVHRMIEK